MRFFILCVIIIMNILQSYNNTEIKIECPKNFQATPKYCTLINNTCPFPETLPFYEYKTILKELRILNETKLNVQVDTAYGYNIWNETGDLYGKLFTQNFENVTMNNEIENCITFDPNESFNTFKYKSGNYCNEIPYFCSYHNTIIDESTSFCNRFDVTCMNHTNVSRTGCYCNQQTNTKHFCELTCNNNNSDICNNDTTNKCITCNETYVNDYKKVRIQLNFDRKTKNISIVITNYKILIPLEGERPIYCFTNADHTNDSLTYRYEQIQDYYKVSENSYKLNYKLTPRFNGTGRYWCVGFTDDRKKISSSDILAEKFDFNFTRAFTLNITVSLNSNNTFIPLDIHETTREYLWNSTNNITDGINFIRLYPKVNQTKIKIAYRIYVSNSTETYKELFEKITGIIGNETVSQAPSFCLGESTVMGDFNLTWHDTDVGKTVMAEELCLGTNRAAVTRTCLGDYLYGAYWSKVKGACQQFKNDDNDSQNNKTIEIYLLKIDTSIENEAKLKHLKDYFNNNTENLIDADLYYATEVIKQITNSTKNNNNNNLSELIEVISRLMDVPEKRLNSAQNLINVTDNLLYNLDEAVSILSITNETFLSISTKNIYVLVSSLNRNNVRGAAVYESDGRITMVPINKTIQKFTPNELKNLKMVTYLGTRDMKINASLVVIVFRTNHLFQQKNTYKNTGLTTSIFLTGGFDIQDNLQIYTKPNRKYRANLVCKFWSYGLNPLWYNTHGAWSGNYITIKHGSNLHLCMYDHTTHFGILVGKEGSIALNIITAIGCTVSTVGALGIITTALFMKIWREQTGTKLLLNVAGVLILRNCFLFVSTAIDSYTEETLCIIVGVFLHYSVISQFCWMLIVGYLQYRRFVLVLVDEKKYLILKLCVYAWGVPIVPIVAKLIDSKSDYLQDDYCYLKSKPLYYFVFIPVCLVIIINLVIFGTIIYAFYKNKTRGRYSRNSTAVLQIKLAILLFFILGFSWIFGILAGFLRTEVFSYLFSILATLEGFVMFVYYILFNKTTRQMWARALKKAQSIQTMSDWISEKRKMGAIKLKSNNTSQE